MRILDGKPIAEAAQEMNARRPSRRRPMNLTVSEDLADAARALGVNASQAAEAGIAAAVNRSREAAWLKANQAAIDEHAAWLDRHGMPLEPAWPV
jgi:antitoxin CcdA